LEKSWVTQRRVTVILTEAGALYKSREGAITSSSKEVTLIATDGLIFVDGFAGPNWTSNTNVVGEGSTFWIPPSRINDLDIVSGNAAYFRTAAGEFPLFPINSGYHQPLKRTPASCLAVINDTRTDSSLMLGNVNPFIGTKNDCTLSTKAFIESEYPGLIKATVV
jgi:hypothetical protein